MTTYVFLLRTLTNLHAGSGDAGGYGVVDKLVQRDPTTNLPTIHASGIKGALREYFSVENPLPTAEVIRIFGSDPKDRDADKVQRGEYRFFNADLLGLPQPDHSANSHFKIVENSHNSAAIQKKMETLGAKGLSLALTGSTDGNLAELAEDLPVIARNFLDNGLSKNLWYEEVVPRESIFVSCIQAPDDVLAKKLHGSVVQLGGNATVGYGYCLFEQRSPKTAATDEKTS